MVQRSFAMSRELLLADEAVEVQADELKSLEPSMQSLAAAIQSDGIQAEHFQGRQVSDVLRAVQAVAMQHNLTYDQVTQFPGYTQTPDLLRTWLEFVFLTRLGMSSCRELVTRTAVVCYLPPGKRYRLCHLIQPLGSLPLAVVHGNSGKLLFRIYTPFVDSGELEIGAQCNEVSRDLSMLPGVPPLTELSRKNGFKMGQRIDQLVGEGKPLEEAKTLAKIDALAAATTKITALEMRGIVYEAFGQAVGPRINLCDERLMQAALHCLRVFRDVVRSEQLRDKIQQLVRRYGTSRSEALAQPARLGKEFANFQEMVQQRRELLSRFRNQAPILPDYTATFDSAHVSDSLREHAMESDEETTLIPACVLNEECQDPAAAFRLATEVSEDWSALARWETRCQQVTLLKFDAEQGQWQYKLAGSDELQIATPDEVEEQFYWTPQPYAMVRAKRLIPEDLQFKEHIRADLGSAYDRHGYWR
jgi:hypothetical protein